MTQEREGVDDKMKMLFTQIYIQVGVTFPFNHMFQRYLSAETTKLVEPSPRFIELYGEDYNLVFNVSAKKELAINEIVGPRVTKRDKYVEFSIFLPFTPIMQRPNPNESALEHLFEGVYDVLGRYEIDILQLKAEQGKLIGEIMSSAEMFGFEDE